MYNAIDLAKYIVSKCIKDDSPISNLQLQKIMFCIQKDFLSRDEIAFPDDIEAWPFGPAIPDVYYHYCGFGVMPISFSIENFDISLKPEDTTIIDNIIESKRTLEPWELLPETNKPGGAWDQVHQECGKSKVIPIDLIKQLE